MMHSARKSGFGWIRQPENGLGWVKLNRHVLENRLLHRHCVFARACRWWSKRMNLRQALTCILVAGILVVALVGWKSANERTVAASLPTLPQSVSAASSKTTG